MGRNQIFAYGHSRPKADDPVMFSRMVLADNNSMLDDQLGIGIGIAIIRSGAPLPLAIFMGNATI